MEFNNYYEYLRSEEWQQKRVERLKMDGFKCACCGSPSHLHVHHLNYDNVYDEDVAEDLITLCRNCHHNIEREKESFTGYSYSLDAPKDVIEAFWRDMEPLDRSNGGTLDFCQYDVIAREWTAWLLRNGMAVYTVKHCPKLLTQGHFRDLRIGKILDLKAKGFRPQQIVKSGISQAMVYKYYHAPELANDILNFGMSREKFEQREKLLQELHKGATP